MTENPYKSVAKEAWRTSGRMSWHLTHETNKTAFVAEFDISSITQTIGQQYETWGKSIDTRDVGGHFALPEVWPRTVIGNAWRAMLHLCPVDAEEDRIEMARSLLTELATNNSARSLNATPHALLKLSLWVDIVLVDWRKIVEGRVRSDRPLVARLDDYAYTAERKTGGLSFSKPAPPSMTYLIDGQEVQSWKALVGMSKDQAPALVVPPGETTNIVVEQAPLIEEL